MVPFSFTFICLFVMCFFFLVVIFLFAVVVAVIHGCCR